MLQGRILSYPDAHRYRLGVNYEQLPVNKCPYMVNNFERDGKMRVDRKQTALSFLPRRYWFGHGDRNSTRSKCRRCNAEAT